MLALQMCRYLVYSVQWMYTLSVLPIPQSGEPIATDVDQGHGDCCSDLLGVVMLMICSGSLNVGLLFFKSHAMRLVYTSCVLACACA